MAVGAAARRQQSSRMRATRTAASTGACQNQIQDGAIIPDALLTTSMTATMLLVTPLPQTRPIRTRTPATTRQNAATRRQLRHPDAGRGPGMGRRLCLPTGFGELVEAATRSQVLLAAEATKQMTVGQLARTIQSMSGIWTCRRLPAGSPLTSRRSPSDDLHRLIRQPKTRDGKCQ